MNGKGKHKSTVQGDIVVWIRSWSAHWLTAGIRSTRMCCILHIQVWYQLMQFRKNKRFGWPRQDPIQERRSGLLAWAGAPSELNVKCALLYVPYKTNTSAAYAFTDSLFSAGWRVAQPWYGIFLGDRNSSYLTCMNMLGWPESLDTIFLKSPELPTFDRYPWSTTW